MVKILSNIVYKKKGENSNGIKKKFKIRYHKLFNALPANLAQKESIFTFLNAVLIIVIGTRGANGSQILRKRKPGFKLPSPQDQI